MLKRAGWLIVLISFFFCGRAYCQQDVQFHLISHLFPGKNIIKVKRDYHDPYLWALSQNNGVYRINSLTLSVDDYSAAFSAYNNMKFVDIAGCSQDTVFVATNSSTLLELKKGVLKVISSADGITGNIKQIGIDYSKVYDVVNDTTRFWTALDIATTTNLFSYYIENDEVAPTIVAPSGPANLFETTYRNKIFSYPAGSNYNINDSAKSLSLSMQLPITLYNGYIWYNTPALGYHIYTAYCIKSYYPDNFNYAAGGLYNEIEFMNQAYGTEQGLYLNNWGTSYFEFLQYNHYLDGIKVNKITSIYGLISFPQLLKENLLVGTDNGLYYSNSGYEKYSNGGINTYNSFTLDNDIGNKVINDICVDATSYSSTICEDAAWVAVSDGLYFIKPDYTPYTGTTQIQAINFKNQPDTLSQLNICAGSGATAEIINSVYQSNNIQWYKNGSELPGQTADTLSITSSGNYRAVLYDPCENIHIQSNQLIVNITSVPQFTFNYPDTLKYCNTASATLNVTYSPSYHYRWYQNDVLNGDTISSLTVTQSGKYKVEVSACTNSWVPSKEVQVAFVNPPVFLITANKSVYCAGDTATLSTGIATDSSYTINWYKDNNLITADKNLSSITAVASGNYFASITSNIAGCGSSATYNLTFVSAPAFTFNYPDELNYCAGSTVTLTAQGSPNYQYRWYKNDTLTNLTTSAIGVTQSGTYSVEVSACANSWVPSKQVLVKLIQLPIPAISADKTAYCTGDNATLSINVPQDPYYNINWYRDNVLLPAYTNQYIITTNIAGNYNAAVVSTITNTDGSVCSQNSNIQSIIFNPTPTLSINQMVNTNLCQGQTVGLQAVYSSGTIKWSTGQTTDEIAVTSSGTYTAALTTAAGCTVDDSTTVAFLPDPKLNVNDTTICTFKNQTVTLTAPAGFAKYEWNNVTGNQTYTITTPQTVALTVTDVNGCQTTQQIHVTEQCPDVEIPNAFTPNGDGLNDTWNVQGLDNTSTVKIFTRYGSLLYQSKGYTTPWNGSYRNQKLPAGVYYYIITAKAGKQNFSGSVTIIY